MGLTPMSPVSRAELPMTVEQVSVSPNQLLARLPAADYQRLLADLKTTPLSVKQVLQKASERLQRVYFPGGGVISIMHVTTDGQVVEMTAVGNEGLVGISACLGGGFHVGEAVVQIPNGSAQALDLHVFRREMDRHGAFADVIHRYGQACLASLMHSVACNALHTVEERLARWLLLSHDRMGRQDFRMTQETLASILGVRRSTITLAFNALRRAGLIDHASKKIIIKNRAGLEGAACECYAAVKGHFARLLG
jgi:CRP-like cAMP-binding protein